MSNQYTIYEGKWPCKTCHEEVITLRLWSETGDVTWLCSNKHLSKMNLVPPKKTKKDFKNE